MNNKFGGGGLIYHILGILTVVIWGTTFISSKVLLQDGMTAQELFTLRFLMAYICIWFISPRRLMAWNWKDEGIFLLLGLTGGSLYFISENVALTITYVNNVSFIVCASPLLATLLALGIYKRMKATAGLIFGSTLALAGVGVVIFNGQFNLQLNPLGDTLAVVASLSWAVYSLLIKRLSDNYSAVFITRKVFFYGLITVLPMFLYEPWQFPLERFLEPQVCLNFLFLGFLASFVCFLVWSLVIQKIGALKATNYVYINPVSTVVASALFLHEPMTTMAYIGCALILGGVYWAGKATVD